MAGDLRSPLPTGARKGTSRTLPIAVVLSVLVVLAAGVGGTSEFTGARWFPHFRPSDAGPPTGTAMLPVGGNVGEQQGRPGSGAVPVWLIVIACVLAAVLLTVLLWRWRRDRRQPAVPRIAGFAAQTMTQPVRSEQVVEAEPEADRLLTGIELASAALDEGLEPADAVVRAWIGLQETAENSGIGRIPSETPTEFTTRILSGAFADDRAVRTLLRLYLRTRFGDHPVSAQDVSEVREALEQLVSSWRSTDDASTTRAR